MAERRDRTAVAGIAGALGVSGPVASGGPRVGGGTPFAGGDPGSSNGSTELGTPKEFLAAKSPATEMDRIAVLAYYLTHAQGVPHFNTKELNKLNVEAAQPRLSNASYAVSNATKKAGYLTAAPGGLKQITARGEALVANLPDRAAAKAAADAVGSRPRRSAGGPRRKKTAAE